MHKLIYKLTITHIDLYVLQKITGVQSTINFNNNSFIFNEITSVKFRHYLIVHLSPSNGGKHDFLARIVSFFRNLLMK